MKEYVIFAACSWGCDGGVRIEVLSRSVYVGADVVRVVCVVCQQNVRPILTRLLFHAMIRNQPTKHLKHFIRQSTPQKEVLVVVSQHGAVMPDYSTRFLIGCRLDRPTRDRAASTLADDVLKTDVEDGKSCSATLPAITSWSFPLPDSGVGPVETAGVDALEAILCLSHGVKL